MTNQIKEYTPVHGETLESVLGDLFAYGCPRLACSTNSDTWYCSIEMRTRSIGSKFEVSSEFGHPTPVSAALEARERMREALDSIGKGK